MFQTISLIPFGGSSGFLTGELMAIVLMRLALTAIAKKSEDTAVATRRS